MLAQFDMIGTNQQQMEQQIRQSFEQQSGQRGISMKVVEVKKMTIRGQEDVEVTILEGSDEKGFVMRQLLTSFPGKKGTVMLMIMGPVEFWDEGTIDEFIQSIH